ncbi:hypothetical protein MHBO_001295 [Bonamia ostreae]|uniref:Uncharacterized protein n=1 Tax=Bonamia ostreae TaxID=126728 RepID=A0ABV2AIL6_9EUKA
MAYNVIESLSDLAKKHNKLVIFTIHQPRSNIFELFDKMMLISKGKVVYFGEANQAVTYFANLGFHTPPGFNFTDYILDQTAPDYRTPESEVKSLKQIKYMHKKWEENRHKIELEIYSSGRASTGEFELKNLSTMRYQKRKDNICVQVPVLLKRQLTEYFRNYVLIAGQIFQQIIAALLIGGVFFNLKSDFAAVQNIQGVLFYMTLNQTVTPMFEMISVFFVTKFVYLREYNADFYSCFSYYISTYIVNSMMQPVYSLAYAGIIYLMAGLRRGARHFFILYAALILCKYCSTSFAFLMSCAFSKYQYAQTVTPVMLYLFTLLGGLYINLNAIVQPFNFLQYLDFLRYAYQVLLNNEFEGRSFACSSSATATVCPVPGEAIIDKVGLRIDNFVEPMLAMVAIMIGVAILGALALWLRTPRFKKLNKKTHYSNIDNSINDDEDMDVDIENNGENIEENETVDVDIKNNGANIEENGTELKDKEKIEVREENEVGIEKNGEN